MLRPFASAWRLEPYPPFASKDASGKWVGWEIDLMDAVCKAMSGECKIVETSWDGIIPALQAKQIDVIWSSMSITNERKKVIEFTDKYYNTPTAIIGPKDEKFGVAPDDLKGKTIGVQVSTVHQNYVEKHYVPAGAKVKTYQTQDEADQDLSAGRVDAVQADSIALGAFLATDQGKACCDMKGNVRRIRRFSARVSAAACARKTRRARKAQCGHQEGPRIGRLR